jgi:undecaprenyl-diphosphatase
LSFLHILVIAIIQGVTEFLPISSSGHLVLIPHLTSWPDQGRLMDVAVHVGTLAAILIYCWRSLFRMLAGVVLILRGRSNDGFRQFSLLIVATLPVVIAGYGMAKYLNTPLRGVEVVAWATLGFGILLWVVDRTAMTVRQIAHLTFRDALIIGLAQVLALIPGTSRAGITMTVGRLLGMERAAAAEFSLLLAIPAILGAGLLEGQTLYSSGNLALTKDAAIAAGLAFVTALIAVTLMMAWLKRASFAPFVMYRVVLGVGLLSWIYWP